MSTEKQPITGREGGPIALQEAAGWTKNYRERHPDQTISHLFGKDILNRILGQEGCLGVRFYYAHDPAGEKRLVIVGVRDDGSEITGDKADTAATGVSHELFGVGDQSAPCPGSPGCPKSLLSDGK
jgi:hypothetical protein